MLCYAIQMIFLNHILKSSNSKFWPVSTLTYVDSWPTDLNLFIKTELKKIMLMLSDQMSTTIQWSHTVWIWLFLSRLCKPLQRWLDLSYRFYNVGLSHFSLVQFYQFSLSLWTCPTSRRIGPAQRDPYQNASGIRACCSLLDRWNSVIWSTRNTIWYNSIFFIINAEKL